MSIQSSHRCVQLPRYPLLGHVNEVYLNGLDLSFLFTSSDVLFID